MTSLAGLYDIEAEQGASFSLEAIYENPTGTPVNLTGYTAKMQVRETITSAVIIEFSTSNGRITLGGAAGTIAIAASATTMAAIDWGQFVYDLELTSAGGVVTRLLEGSFKVDPEVTR